LAEDEKHVTRTLYIHVGPIKTGTSAIQHVLSKHDNSVILYPKVGIAKAGSHAGLVYDFIGKSTSNYKPAADPTESFSKIAHQAAKSHLNLLLSSEVLLPPITTSEHARRDIRGFIAALLDQLETGNWEVEILFACREHYERAESAYNQRIKGTAAREQRDPDAFLLENVSGLQYAPVVRSLRATGFKTTVLNYHPSTTWVERFLLRLGFSEHHLPDVPAKNVSLTPPTLIARLAANRIIRSPSKRKDFAESVRNLRRAPRRAGSIFHRETIAEVEALFRIDRQFISEEFGITLPQPNLGGNVFFLDPHELAEIASAARKLGQDGEAIVEIAGSYLRK
jgi:hypothetical protein